MFLVKNYSLKKRSYAIGDRELNERKTIII